jgi:hypothetical protein
MRRPAQLVTKTVALCAAVVVGVATLTTTATVASADPDYHRGLVEERPRDAAVHIVDGEVHSVAQVGGTVVMGGRFSTVGPVTRGAAGVVDIPGKTFRSTFPDVVGAVKAAVPDGSGGWYVGGEFVQVGGQDRRNLAHVRADGTVSPFDPRPNGPVDALRVTPAGDVLVGGGFTELDGNGVGRLARVSPAGDLVWNGSANGGVTALAVSADGETVFVGGSFSSIGGLERRRLAAVSTATGAPVAAFAPGTVNNTVLDLTLRGSAELVISGQFTSVNGVTRQRLAVVDASNGNLAPLSVSINGTIRDLVLDATGATAYIVGDFGSVGGQPRNKLAGVDLASGAVTAVQVGNLSGGVSAVATDGTAGLFIGGSFQVNPEKDNPAVVARLALVNNAVTSVVPYAQTPRSLARPPLSGVSGANALVSSGASLFVGGDFSDYGVTERRNLLAYDLATGALLPGFNPAPDADVNSVKSSPDGTAVFVGGDFNAIGGVARARIAKVAVPSGQVDGEFTASASAYVKDMAVRPDGRALYVGGAFDTVNGSPASKLVALSPTNGTTLDDFNVALTEPTNDFSEGGVRAMALSPDASTLMVVGNFRKAAGQDRPLMAQIDVSGPTATVTSWRTTLYDQPCARSGKIGFMRDIDISPDGRTAYVVTAGHFYYPACDSVNAFSMQPGDDVQPVWTKKIGDTLESVAASRDAVYISGHFRYLETETRTEKRFQIAALDPGTGNGLNWVPNAGGFRGVLTMELEPSGLFAGSDGDAFGGVNHGRNAFWPTPIPGMQVSRVPHRPWLLAPGGTVRVAVRVQNTFTDRPVTLTALNDSRLGDLAPGCSLPATIPAGEIFECTVPDTVTGAALDEVTATSTASGTANGQELSDVGRSSVQLLSSAPVFRIRAVAGPGVVSFPGDQVRFSVTTMNLDLERPAAVQSLTSPQLGDLSAECGFPRTLGPNATVTCHIDRQVAGSVGSKPSTGFTATARYDTGTLTSSSSTTVTISPPVAGTNALMVVANPGSVTGADAKLRDRLARSYSVAVADDDTVNTASLDPALSFVVLAPSVVEARLRDKLRAAEVPVLATHGRLLDEMGMTATADNGSVNATTVTMTGPPHPLSTARAGTLTVSSQSRPFSWGVPSAAASAIFAVQPGRPSSFVYEPGAAMPGGEAAACRVFSNALNPTNFTTAAWALFDRAAAYASMNCGRNMLWTAAGAGGSVYGGDGAQALASGLNAPWGLAIDSQGRVHIADGSAHAVRRINANGTMTTVAGTGTAGFSGDGGPATSARLNAPVRLAFDASDNLYIADSANHRIRRVTPQGVISTVAGNGTAGYAGDGGPATAARLRVPYDVVVRPDGAFYIADRDNHRVRFVDTNGVISTVAGTGVAGYNGDDIAATTARLNTPYSVELDGSGGIYIADFNSERVRQVDSDGIITTFAGTGIASANGDGGPAEEAGLHKPQYVDVLPNGDVLISESNNNDVRIVHDGLIDVLAGSRQFGYSGDGGPPLFSTWSRPSATAADGEGNIWIVDRGNRRIRVIEAN